MTISWQVNRTEGDKKRRGEREKNFPFLLLAFASLIKP
jgi:hypothetical protein